MWLLLRNGFSDMCSAPCRPPPCGRKAHMPEDFDTERPAPSGGLMHPGDLGAALMLLTRLPVPAAWVAHRSARSSWAWPLAGLVVGLIAGAVAAVALALGLAPALAAGLALTATILSTGALHEDGLADCADGFWGGQDRDRRLEIMKDSRIGTYGVLALIVATGLRWVALAALFSSGWLWAGLIVPAALSRGAMAGIMADLPFARDDGVARSVGKPSRSTAGVAFVLGALIAIATAGVAGIFTVLAVALTAIAASRVARVKIGGQTGDVLGAVQQLAEIAALLSLVAVLT